jgi:integrase/recombinase XerD
METEDKNILPEKIKDEIMGKSSSKSFFKYAEKYLNDLDYTEKIGTYRHTKAIIGKMKDYCGGRDLLFDYITVSWLKAYEQNLRTKIGNKINTVNGDFRVIRRIINAAIDEEVITEDKNHFRRFKMSVEKVKRDYLTEEELNMVDIAPLQKNSNKDHHRNMFVFSAYAGGLRISDMLLLKWKNIIDGKVIVQTRKTSSVVSIKLPSRALEILKLYKKKDSKPEDFIFPFLKNDEDYSNKRKLYNAISSATTYTNDDLKDIAKIINLEKRLSFHTARHTFATLALKKTMRIEYVSKLMGHANIQTTQIYAKIVSEELDKAMEVFN